MSIEIIVRNEQETDILGRVLAKEIKPGSIVSLTGTLGAGKTRLVQAFATACGVPRDEIGSPTFVLIKEYHGDSRTIYHFDAYRLRDSDEFLELGVGEYFESDGISFVEWSEKVEDAIPEDRIEIAILPLDETVRRIEISTKGNVDPKFETSLIERWQKASTPRLK